MKPLTPYQEAGLALVDVEADLYRDQLAVTKYQDQMNADWLLPVNPFIRWAHYAAQIPKLAKLEAQVFNTQAKVAALKAIRKAHGKKQAGD